LALQLENYGYADYLFYFRAGKLLGYTTIEKQEMRVICFGLSWQDDDSICGTIHSGNAKCNKRGITACNRIMGLFSRVHLSLMGDKKRGER